MSDREKKFERDWNLVQVTGGALSGEVLGELIRRGARIVQDEADLKVDGLAGPATISEIEAQLNLDENNSKRGRTGKRRPIPDHVAIPTSRGVELVYGSPRYQSHPSKPGAIIMEKKWVRENIVKCTMHNGLVTWCHRLVCEEWVRLFEKACTVSGYTPTKVWSWVARRKMWRDDKGVSMHAYGVAFDVDPALNKYGMSKGTPLHEHPSFVDVFENAGWTWGGRWGDQETGRGCDPHHFERVRY